MPTLDYTVSSELSYSQTTGSDVSITISDGAINTALGSIYSTAFVQRVAVALAIACNAILKTEDNTVPNITSRRDFARLAQSNYYRYAENIAFAVAADGVTGDASSDPTLVDRVLAIWDQISYGA